MRLWTLHPNHLDTIGLVALWREALLARAVLRGRTAGYTRHPQLARFRAASDPVAAINAYLGAIHAEAVRRGFRFDASKLRGRHATAKLPGSRGQIEFEWAHLLSKVKRRSPAHHRLLLKIRRPRAHPQFTIRRGPMAEWEKGAAKKR